MASQQGTFFWSLPAVADDELPDPDEDQAYATSKSAAMEEQPQPAPPPVVWPPIASQLGKDTGGPASAGGVESRGRDRRKGGSAAKKDGAEKGTGEVGPGGAAPKRRDGWLPKAEYEAKKREERARRQKELEQVRDQGDGGAGSRGRQGNGRSGRSPADWEDLIPLRPAPQEETAERRALREAEEAAMRARDQLRSAATAEELRVAIKTAQALALVEEVRIAERKLARMEG
mmetsp:Transcript_96701/g.216639  ORF Transcript_96701/g.216639 Transcript_96701/m.216639 type:complete len:231 (-) Transcript_96701:88-780(-)